MNEPTAGEVRDERAARGRVDDSILTWSDLRAVLAADLADHHPASPTGCECGAEFYGQNAWAEHVAGRVEEVLWSFHDDGVYLTADDRLREALRLADGYPVVSGDESYQEVRTENLLAAQAHAAIAQAIYARQQR